MYLQLAFSLLDGLLNFVKMPYKCLDMKFIL
jgi:hypothetical protein